MYYNNKNDNEIKHVCAVHVNPLATLSSTWRNHVVFYTCPLCTRS